MVEIGQILEWGLVQIKVRGASAPSSIGQRGWRWENEKWAVSLFPMEVKERCSHALYFHINNLPSFALRPFSLTFVAPSLSPLLCTEHTSTLLSFFFQLLLKYMNMSFPPKVDGQYLPPCIAHAFFSFHFSIRRIMMDPWALL